jgi:hypothetical protein
VVNTGHPKERESWQQIPLGQQWQDIGATRSGFQDFGYTTYRERDRLLLTQNHSRAPNGEYLVGGPFEVSKCDITVMRCPFVEDYFYNSALNWWIRARGNFVPNVGQGATTIFDGLRGNFLQTAAYGTKGWNRYKPGTSEASMGQFLAELRQVPRIPNLYRFWRAGTRNFLKYSGDEYLNAVFGWRPFANDLVSFVRTTHDMSKVITQLGRDNGKAVRRHGPIHSDTTTATAVTTGTGYPPSLLPAVNNLLFVGNWKKTVTTTQKVDYWFSGRFRYYIPDFGTLQWQRRFLSKLYGVEPSPQLLWNLIPWSWAIDWFTNVGDTMSNFTGNMAENLVADYAYVMEHRVATTETLIEFSTRSGPKSCSATVVQESKYRIPASPFGFGLTWDGFNSKQLAIMAALVFSRA